MQDRAGGTAVINRRKYGTNILIDCSICQEFSFLMLSASNNMEEEASFNFPPEDLRDLQSELEQTAIKIEEILDCDQKVVLTVSPEKHDFCLLVGSIPSNDAHLQLELAPDKRAAILSDVSEGILALRDRLQGRQVKLTLYVRGLDILEKISVTHQSHIVEGQFESAEESASNIPNTVHTTESPSISFNFSTDDLRALQSELEQTASKMEEMLGCDQKVVLTVSKENNEFCLLVGSILSNKAPHLQLELAPDKRAAILADVSEGILATSYTRQIGRPVQVKLTLKVSGVNNLEQIIVAHQSHIVEGQLESTEESACHIPNTVHTTESPSAISSMMESTGEGNGRAAYIVNSEQAISGNPNHGVVASLAGSNNATVRSQQISASSPNVNANEYLPLMMGYGQLESAEESASNIPNMAHTAENPITIYSMMESTEEGRNGRAAYIVNSEQAIAGNPNHGVVASLSGSNNATVRSQQMSVSSPNVNANEYLPLMMSPVSPSRSLGDADMQPSGRDADIQPFDNWIYFGKKYGWRIVVALLVCMVAYFNYPKGPDHPTDRSARILECASDLSMGHGLDTSSSPQSKAVAWFTVGAGIGIDPPDKCSWESTFGILYALIVIRESMGVADVSWHTTKPLASTEEVCHWSRITCDLNKKVQRLILNKAGLSGCIPLEIAGLMKLSTLDLDSNDGLIGTIPSVLGALTGLEFLYLQRTSLGGVVPTALGSLTNLKQLLLDKTHLSGTMPTEICNLRKGELESLHASCGGTQPLIQCDHPSCCSSC
jgi:hypothetical protein